MQDRKELVKYAFGKCLDIGTKDAYPFGGKLPPNFIGVDINPVVDGCMKVDVCKGLPFPDKSFDCVTAFEFFEHISPECRQFVVSEIKRVCKSRVIISVPDKNDERNFPSNEPDHPHNQHPDWLFDFNEVMSLAKQFSDKFTLYDIEGIYYKGYGLVIDL